MVIQLLESLHEKNQNIEKMQKEIENLIDFNLSQEIKDVIYNLNKVVDCFRKEVDTITKQIKNEVLKLECSQSSENMIAIWNKGRVSIDSARILEYAETHPEVQKFIKSGSPYIAIKSKS